ncbi:MAG: hypothetical protein UZ09_BCD002002405 [Bacteroidetes bacterium OLB9]|nr:MAG: hypothetical protein UZ09_BCD002002405 [Bacteroidetes bacterium OLB9]
MVTLGIYSCAKDNNSETAQSKDQTVESRSSSTACSPQTLFTEYTICTHTQKTVPISFALGLGLYSTASNLFQMCPNLQVMVSYTFSTCTNGSNGTETHFVHNLTYDLNAMKAACPALQTAINNHTAQGTLVSFLDMIDHEISMQTEYTEVFNATKLNNWKYLCKDRGNWYSVKYIKNTCYKWVVLGNPETGKYEIHKRDCGGSVCCARSNDYCVESYYNGEPNLVTGTPTNYQKFEGQCEVECTHDCGAPDPNSF